MYSVHRSVLYLVTLVVDPVPVLPRFLGSTLVARARRHTNKPLTLAPGEYTLGTHHSYQFAIPRGIA